MDRPEKLIRISNIFICDDKKLVPGYSISPKIYNQG